MLTVTKACVNKVTLNYLSNVNEHFSIKRLTELIHISMSVELECYCFTGINILTLVKVLERAADRFNFVSKKKKK